VQHEKFFPNLALFLLAAVSLCQTMPTVVMGGWYQPIRLTPYLPYAPLGSLLSGILCPSIQTTG
jgi:hypothetical protein